MPFVQVPDGRIDDAAVEQMVASFHEEYEKRWGQRFDYLPVQGAVYRVELVVPAEKVSYPTLEQRASGVPEPRSRTELRYLEDEPLDAAVYERGDLLAGDVIEGPAVIREPLCTTIVCPRQTATVGSVGEIAIEAA
jgi:N-methylhydantoinase A